MRNLSFALLLSALVLFFTSCEKDEFNAFGNIDVAAITNSSAYIFGSLQVEDAVKKGVLVSEHPNVNETNSVIFYEDAETLSKAYSIEIKMLYANTNYYFKVFYIDKNGAKFYSDEKTFTTTNDPTATIFGRIVSKDTILNNKVINQVSFKLLRTNGERTVEYGMCYSKTSTPTINDKKIVGEVDGDGKVLCSTATLNFYDSIMVRPYCKSSKGVDYGAAEKYSRTSWVSCGTFPGFLTLDPGSIVYRGKGYIFLGFSPGEPEGLYGVNSGLWSFNSETLKWEKEASFSNAVSFDNSKYYIANMNSAPLSNGFLLFKGKDYSGRSYNRFFIYNDDNKTCTQINPTGINDLVLKYSWGSYGFSVDGQAYVCMYRGGAVIENTSGGTFIYKYNESSKSFEKETENLKRLGEGGVVNFVLGHTLYVGAGTYSFFNTAYTKDFWSYNLKTKVWKQLKDAPISDFRKSFVCKNRCFAIDFKDNILYEYKVEDDSWVVLEKLPFEVHAVLPFDDGLYAFTVCKEKVDREDKNVNRVFRCCAL